MGLSGQERGKGGCVVTVRLGIRPGGRWLVEGRVDGTGRNLCVSVGVRGAGETSGVLPHDFTAGGRWQGSESGCSGVLGLVWQPG